MNRWWLLFAIAFAGWPLGGWFAACIGEDPWHLLPLLAAFVLLVQADAPEKREAPPLGATIAMLAYAASQAFLTPSLQACLLVVAATLAASPSFFQRRLEPAFGALLLLSLPVIPLLQLFVGYPLRVISGTLAAGLLRVSGLAAEHAGAVLCVEGEIFAVDAPCSGIAMWWTALLIAAWVAARSRASVGRTLLGALLATVCVIFCNGLRSAALVQLQTMRFIVPDWMHEGVGLMTFALCAVGILFVLERAMRGGPRCSAS